MAPTAQRFSRNGARRLGIPRDNTILFVTRRWSMSRLIWLTTLGAVFEVVEPGLAPEVRRLRPSDLQDKNFPRQMFYASVISDQLERASKARGRALRPGEDPAFEASWAGYHRSVLANIKTVNQLLRDDARYTEEAPATLAILQLLISDLKVALFLWKAHLRGFLAYVEHRGGASAIMKLPKPEKSRLSPILAYVAIPLPCSIR